MRTGASSTTTLSTSTSRATQTACTQERSSAVEPPSRSGSWAKTGSRRGVTPCDTMIVKVLGSAAGGGFPQANCNCRNCADARAGRPGLSHRTQSALAVTRDGERWVLLNASPDIRQQIAATPALAPPPESAPRSSPIVAVALTDGDVDHVAGLLG